MGHQHNHNHSHGHAHHHHHHVVPSNINTAFIIGLVLNLAFVIVQVVIGLWVHSLSLLSDAGHNLADVGTLALSLLAFKLVKVKANKQYTYGYKKTSVLVALFNAVLLLLSIGAIAYEAAHRLLNPEPLPGLTIALVAGIGVIINAASALLFFKDKDSDLNIKSAYLHLLSDALVSLGIVVGGIIIYYTQWYWVDSILSIVIGIIILISTWHLLRDSLRLSLDGVPVDISVDDVRETAMKVHGVKGLHHIHIWAISTTENALTAHLVLASNTTNDEEHRIKHNLRHALAHKNIQHITLETERDNEHCEAEEC